VLRLNTKLVILHKYLPGHDGQRGNCGTINTATKLVSLSECKCPLADAGGGPCPHRGADHAASQCQGSDAGDVPDHATLVCLQVVLDPDTKVLTIEGDRVVDDTSPDDDDDVLGADADLGTTSAAGTATGAGAGDATAGGVTASGGVTAGDATRPRADGGSH
jgi:hypothetical protein